MNTAEIFIAHILYDDPDQLHVTPDGEKLYFLLNGHLMYIEAAKGTSYNGMSDDELNRVLQNALTDKK